MLTAVPLADAIVGAPFHALSSALHGALASALASDVLPLLQAAARTLPDTIYTKAVTTEPTTLQRVAEVLRALMTLAIVALTFAVVPAAWNFRKSYQKVSDLLDKVYADVNPIAHHASRIAENVDYVSSAVRADVQRVSASVSEAEARLKRAIDRAEARARELEALIDVARAEAQDSFVAAASAVRGVRAGLAAFQDDAVAGERPPRARRSPRRSELVAEAEALDDVLDGELEDALEEALDEVWDEAVDAAPGGVVSPAPARGARVLRESAFLSEGAELDEDVDAAIDARVVGPRVRPRRVGRARPIDGRAVDEQASEGATRPTAGGDDE